MKPFSFLLLFTGIAAAADLNVWEIDDSCNAHLPALRKAYNDAELMATKALDDINTLVDKKRPYFTRQNRDATIKWDRVARAVLNMFGLTSSKEKGLDPANEYVGNILYVYERMVKTLRDGQMVPENGYNNRRPLLLCDRDKFVWVGLNDKDPNDFDQRTLQESRGGEMPKGHIGAWVYRDRYITSPIAGEADKICKPYEYAVTMTKLDFIIFCPLSFGNEVANTRSAVDVRDDEMTEDNTLDQFGHNSLSRVMVHEFTHWFGGAGNGLLTERNVPDQLTVGQRGDPVYVLPNQKRTNDGSLTGAKRFAVYDYLWTTYLARTHNGRDTSGPARATMTAESYAIFAMMSYMDKYDWSGNGRAKPLDKMIDYDKLPNNALLRVFQ